MSKLCPECIKDCEECSSPGVWEDMHAGLVALRARAARTDEVLRQMEVYVVGELEVYPHNVAEWVKQMGGKTWD